MKHRKSRIIVSCIWLWALMGSMLIKPEEHLARKPVIQEEMVISEVISDFIIESAHYAVEHQAIEEIDQGLFKCCVALEQGNTVLPLRDLIEAFPSMVHYFNYLIKQPLKAPRPSAPPLVSGGLLGCSAEILPFLQALQNTIDDCCQTLQGDFDITFNILNDIQLSLIDCCTSLQADFDFTFSLLNSLNPTTSVIINFNNEFQSTWTILADLKATLTACCTSIENNFESTFTSISSLNNTFTSCCAELTQEINNTFTLLSSVQTTLTQCCSAISITLTAISGNFNATFTVLGELQTTLTQCCTDISENFNSTFTILNTGFNSTFTLLTSIQDTLTLCCASSSGCLETFTTIVNGFNGTFTALADIENTLTQCCDEIAANFAGTFSTLAAGFNGTFTALDVVVASLCYPTVIKQSDFGVGGTTPLVISNPGVYIMGENIVYNPAGSSVAITIATSEATLDLQCFTLSQGNATVGVDGVRVNSGLSDVMVKNGAISSFTRAGLTVQSNCQRVAVDNLDVISCAVRGIEFLGAASPNTIRDSMITNCFVTLCSAGASGDYAMVLQQCNRVQLLNTDISNNGALTHALSGLRLDTCQNCNIEEVDILDNIASTTLRGLEIVTTGSSTFTDVEVRGNTATNHVLGIDMNGSANTFNVFTACTSLRSTGGLTVFGINLGANSNNNQFLNCNSSWNNGGSVIGVFLSGGAANNFQNSFIDCIVTGNTATGVGNFVSGFQIDGSGSGGIIRAIVSYNSSAAAIARGIGFVGISGGSNWEVKDTQTIRNIGSSAANSFGIQRVTGTTNLFTRNISFNNGTTAANQLNGVPAGSASAALNTGNLNTASSPWTNLGIIP